MGCSGRQALNVTIASISDGEPTRLYQIPLPAKCTAMPVGNELYLVPQWRGFLARHPDQQCHEPAVLPITADNWARLCDVVAAVSPDYYSPDPAGLDIWDLISPKSLGKGDCEDIALTRRSILALHGMPLGALVPTICKLADGTGHVVLRVITDRGDLIIDNKTNKILPWEDVPYEWVASYTTGLVWLRVTLPPSFGGCGGQPSTPTVPA